MPSCFIDLAGSTLYILYRSKPVQVLSESSWKHWLCVYVKYREFSWTMVFVWAVKPAPDTTLQWSKTWLGGVLDHPITSIILLAILPLAWSESLCVVRCLQIHIISCRKVLCMSHCSHVIITFTWLIVWWALQLTPSPDTVHLILSLLFHWMYQSSTCRYFV